MAAAPIPFPALSNTPVAIRSGAFGEVQTIQAHNPDADAANGAYVKLYRSVAAPDGSAVPAWRGYVPGNSSLPLPAFVSGSHWWIAVATQAAAGLTAPATAFDVVVTFDERI